MKSPLKDYGCFKREIEESELRNIHRGMSDAIEQHSEQKRRTLLLGK